MLKRIQHPFQSARNDFQGARNKFEGARSDFESAKIDFQVAKIDFQEYLLQLLVALSPVALLSKLCFQKRQR